MLGDQLTNSTNLSLFFREASNPSTPNNLYVSHIKITTSNNYSVARTEANTDSSFYRRRPTLPRAASQLFRMSPILDCMESGAHSIQLVSSQMYRIFMIELGRAHLRNCCPTSVLGHFVKKSLSFCLRFLHSPFAHFPMWRLEAREIPLRGERELDYVKWAGSAPAWTQRGIFTQQQVTSLPCWPTSPAVEDPVSHRES